MPLHRLESGLRRRPLPTLFSLLPRRLLLFRSPLLGEFFLFSVTTDGEGERSGNMFAWKMLPKKAGRTADGKEEEEGQKGSPSPGREGERRRIVPPFEARNSDSPPPPTYCSVYGTRGKEKRGARPRCGVVPPSPHTCRLRCAALLCHHHLPTDLFPQQYFP